MTPDNKRHSALSDAGKAFVKKMLEKGHNREQVAVFLASEVFHEIDQGRADASLCPHDELWMDEGGVELCARCGVKTKDPQPTQAERREFFLKIIREWKHFWMNQTQNSKEDFENYFGRAFGIDSNMTHHLSSKLSEAGLIPMEDVKNLLKGFSLLREGFRLRCNDSAILLNADRCLSEFTAKHPGVK